MVECHMHMALDGVDWKAAICRHRDTVDKVFVESVLQAYHRLGYTYLRDGGDKWGVGAYARNLAPRYGIVYKTPYAPLSKAGHYGGFIGLQWENLKEFAQLVKQQKAQGADFLKIMISGLMDFDCFGVLTEEGLTEKEIRELVHIGHQEGLSVMAHANGARVLLAAADAGVDSIEHGAYADDEALAAMAERGVVWVPTVSTVGNLRGKGRFDEGAVSRIFESHMESVGRFASMGGAVASGTDAGAWAVKHGCQTEEGYLTQIGVDYARGNRMIMERF